MKELIEALQLLLALIPKDSYHQEFPTHCEHDVLYVYGVDWKKAKFDDVKKIIKLGFIPGWDENLSFIDDLFGDEFDWDKLTEEQWKRILEEEIDDCCFSYKYGSC